MTRTKKRETGDIGEEIACIYLQNKGFSVIERNYWKPWEEIDIVAQKGQSMRFVEVKSVRQALSGGVSGAGVRPEENMHPGKVQRLHRAIQTYLASRRVPESMDWQIDLACVYVDVEAKKGRVELFENVIL